MKNDTIESNIPKEVITYAAGSIEARLSEIARNTNQPEQELREWVAIFLLSSWTGISDHLPTLRRQTSTLRGTARQMAVVNNSHPKSSSQPSDSSHPVNGNKGRKYKPGTHWTQQPKNKAKLARVSKARHASLKLIKKEAKSA